MQPDSVQDVPVDSGDLITNLVMLGILLTVILIYFLNNPLKHAKDFRIRCFLNWFPLGLTYAFLYMGRYNLTVAKSSLGDLIPNQSFGDIFGLGSVVYGCAFLLKRRKKEFGMYLTLGMKRSNVVTIFVAEMLLTFLFSLAAGLGLGTLVYQAIVAGISSFLEVQLAWADYTSGAFILTIVLVGTVFLITSAVGAGYLRFEKISNLLKGENSKGKPVKNPRK